jgi:hypothetical protein
VAEQLRMWQFNIAEDVVAQWLTMLWQNS